MKTFFLRIAVLWRRFRRADGSSPEHLQHATQLAPLMKRANPFASWIERANWMIDVAEWIRREPKVSRLDREAWTRIKLQRVRIMLDWLDANRTAQRVVRATVQKTFREAAGRGIFCTAGLGRVRGLFREWCEGFIARAVPKPLAQRDLPALFCAMFARPGDADWLLALDRPTLVRLWKICADPAVQHAYRTQIDDALLYLATTIASTGVDPTFSLEQDARIPLQATPFMVLRRELDIYLSARAGTPSSARGVRMLIAMCHAKLDRIYEEIESTGFSYGMIDRIETMRAQLSRMAILVDLRGAYGSEECHQRIQNLFADLLASVPQRYFASAITARTAALLARGAAAREVKHHGNAAVSGRGGYRALVKAACIGGVIAAGGTLAQLALTQAGLAKFFEGAFASMNFAACFLVLYALGGTLAITQPAAAAAQLASLMKASKPNEGVAGLMRKLADIARTHAAAVLGNLLGAVPAALAMAGAASLLAPRQALATIQGLSLFGLTPLFAIVTGVLLWLACVAGGLADNWFALRGFGEALAHHRSIIRVLGAIRAARFARWLERHVSTIGANLALAVLLGATPATASFFGVPFEVRQVVFSGASLAAAAGGVGWAVFESRDFWLALAGVGACWLLNAVAAFACAFAFALKAHEVPRRLRWVLARRAAAAAGAFFLRRKRESNMRLVASAARFKPLNDARLARRTH